MAMNFKEGWILDANAYQGEGLINLINEYYDDDNQHWLEATVRFDGCIHFRRAYNSPFPKKEGDHPEQDYIHICDLPKLIVQLKELLEIAQKHFGDEWSK